MSTEPECRGRRGDRLRIALIASNPRAVEQALATEIDRVLCANPQYQYAARLGQLQPLEAWLLDTTPEQAWRIYEERCQQRGQKLGDIKPTTLAQGDDWEDLFPTQRLQCDSSLGSGSS